MANNLETTITNYCALIVEPVDEILVDELKKAGFKVFTLEQGNQSNLSELISKCHVLVVRSKTKVDRTVLELAKNLKVVARAGIGLDNIDVEEARKRGIKVINAAGASADSVAELTFCFMVMCLRNILASNMDLRSGEWFRPIGYELKGKTLGIIGLGKIGYRVAKIARFFGMHVVAYDIAKVDSKARRIKIKLVKDLHSLLRVSDIITIHVPLTKKTYHMIGEKEFEMMKNGVVIINTSRGAILDGKALLKALKEGKVLSAALDVLENEPPREQWEFELINHRNVIVTPHIGAQTVEAQRRIARILSKKILNEFQFTKV